MMEQLYSAIDTSGAQALPVVEKPSILNHKGVKALPSPLCNVFGFTAPSNTRNLSGPCALACVLDYYQIGWSHIPKDNDQHANNDLFVSEVMKWSNTPDLPAQHMLGSTPAKLQDGLIKAGLRASWFANGTESTTLNYIEKELRSARPVIVLLNFKEQNLNPDMEWHVAFQMDAHSVYTKSYKVRNQTLQWSKSEFGMLMSNNIPNGNRSLLTAAK